MNFNILQAMKNLDKEGCVELSDCICIYTREELVSALDGLREPEAASANPELTLERYWIVNHDSSLHPPLGFNSIDDLVVKLFTLREESDPA